MRKQSRSGPGAGISKVPHWPWLLALPAWVLCAPGLPAAVFSGGKPEWTVDFPAGASGAPVSLGAPEAARGLLVAEPAGRITLISPQGEKGLTMTVDSRLESPVLAADLRGQGRLSIVAVDQGGSVYCFDESGRRQWKFARRQRSGEYRLPVVADLDGDGRRQILMSDNEGHLDVLDADGKLRLEITATKYRLETPAVGDLYGDGKAEIIFGTEGGDVYCVDGQGALQWSTVLDSCFGRALPLIADAAQEGRYAVYFPPAFVNPHPGLFALDAATGRQLWKAPSILQSYRSTVVADVDGDGHNEILFGDKNCTLFCLDAAGRRRWTTQLDGRGIFFAPAVADLEAAGSAVVFAVVRGAGSNGKSLYALDAAGKVIDAVALPGGGGATPVLCRFQGQAEVRLCIISGSNRLLCYRLEQKPAAAKILWPAVRNDAENSGFVKSAKPVAVSRPPEPPQTPATQRPAVGGLNHLDISLATPGRQVVSVEIRQPDQSRRVEFFRLEDGTQGLKAGFLASAPGDYDVTIRTREAAGSAVNRTEHYLYRLDKSFRADAARLGEVVSALSASARTTPALEGLSDCLAASATEALDFARRSKQTDDFDAFHWKCDYYLGLANFCRNNRVSAGLLVRQLANPWENFDAPALFAQGQGPVSAISMRMAGNEYGSAAIALTNLRPYPAVVRLSCGPFQSGRESVEAKAVLEFRDVLEVRPDGIGELVEDPLPLLGEGQTVRLGPGETRKVWLTFHSQALAGGVWRAKLRLGNLFAPTEPPLDVPVALDVSTVRLPAKFAYHECNWLYLDGIHDQGLQEATLRDALEHGMNVFCIPGVSIRADAEGNLGQASTQAHDTLVRKLAGRAFLLPFGPISVQWPPGAHPDAALEQKTLGEALRWYARHMQSLGVDFKDFALYLQDEPGLMGRDANFEAWVARVREFKAAEPRLQLYANPAGGARAELLRPVQDLIDVWAPDLHLFREQPEELKQLFQHGKQWWHYEAPADQRTLDPLGFYRVKPWVAFQLGMNGGGYWVYSAADYWSADGSGGGEYGSVYPTDRGPVTTKRWEASREGIQDFELLRLVRAAAEPAPASERQRALGLLDQAVAFVTRGQEKVTDISRHVRPYTPDFATWMEYRRDLIRLAEELAAANR